MGGSRMSDGQTKRRAVVFVKNIGVGIPLKQPLNHSVIALGCGVVERGALPVVFVIDFEVVD